MHHPRTILCYGDSNTYGYDPRSYLGDRYPETIRWTGLLKNQTDAFIQNCGVPGRQIPRFQYDMQQVQNLISAASFPLSLWIMLGSNDLLNDKTPSAATAAARMKNFLSFLIPQDSFRSGEMQILLIAPPRMLSGEWTTRQIQAESALLGSCLRRTADELCQTHHFSAQQLIFADAGSWDLPVTFDGVHLTETGHRKFAENISHFLGI